MLVATPQPQPTESLMGYLLRLTQANGYHTPAYVLEAMNGHLHRGLIGRMDAAPLRELAGLSNPHIEWLSLKPAEKPKAYTRIFGEDLPTYEVCVQNPKICPACLAAGSVCEAFWDLAQASACPVHRVMLVSRCPGCASPLRWHRPKVAQCRCGLDLTKVPVEEAAPALFELMAALRSAVYKNAKLAPWPDSLPHLSHLNVRQMCKLLWVMSGVFHQRQGGGVQPKARTKYAPQLERVAKALLEWPTGFQRFLSETYEEQIATAPEIPQFRTLFNWLLVRLVKNDENGGTCYRFLEEQLYLFGARFWTRGSMSRDDGDDSLIPPMLRWGTLSEGAEVLGLHMATMKKLIATGEIRIRQVRKRSRRNLFVDLDWARNQKVSRYEPDPVRNAAKRDGVSIPTLKAMIINGVYVATYRPRFPGSLAKEDVDILRERLRALGKGRKCLAGRGVTTVQDAFKKYTASPATKAAFFAHLLANPHLVKSRGNVRILQMKIDIETAEKLLYHNVPAAQGFVTAQDAAVRLRCVATIVVALKRDGHLAIRRGLGRNLICAASLEEFDRKYISLTAITSRLNISKKRIAMYVDYASVRHLRIHGAGGLSLVFIDRRDLEKAEALMEAVRRPPDPRVADWSAVRRRYDANKRSFRKSVSG